jgi:flagella basal body P-ring formation protein FlgA
MAHSSLILWSLLLATSVYAAPAKVVLRESAVLDRHIITLADVAIIESEDAVLRQALSSTRLATLGEPGTPRKLSRSRIAHILSRYLPAWQGSYDLVGAEFVLATMASQSLNTSGLQTWAENTLSARLHALIPGARLDVVAYPMPSRSISYPPGNVSYAVRHMQMVPSQRMAMIVDVLVDGARSLSVPVWLRVQGSVPVMRLKTPTAASASLSSSMVDIIDVPVSDKQLASFPITEINSFRLRHAMPAGALLSFSDLLARKPVERGNEITVKVAQGGILLEDRAVAITEGQSGAAVRLMNPRTHSDYFATVLSVGLAEAR